MPTVSQQIIIILISLHIILKTGHYMYLTVISQTSGTRKFPSLTGPGDSPDMKDLQIPITLGTKVPQQSKTQFSCPLVLQTRTILKYEGAPKNCAHVKGNRIVKHQSGTELPFKGNFYLIHYYLTE